jgi:hypothetical protein
LQDEIELVLGRELLRSRHCGDPFMRGVIRSCVE